MYARLARRRVQQDSPRHLPRRAPPNMVTGEANADGSTLKATVPTLQSPINGVRLPGSQPVVLVAGIRRHVFPVVPLSYRFELTNAAGAVVENVVVASGAGSTTSRTVTAHLDTEAPYQWRVRPEYQGIAGPWSARAALHVARRARAISRGGELYDPLINGKTVGTIVGPVTFIPGVGVRLETVREPHRLRVAAAARGWRVVGPRHESDHEHRGRQDQDFLDGRRATAMSPRTSDG